MRGALARFFLGVAWGINAVNKSVADPGVFRDMVRVAMPAWDTPRAAQRKGSRFTVRGRPNAGHRFSRGKAPENEAHYGVTGGRQGSVGLFA
jgi:hypothetical protein